MEQLQETLERQVERIPHRLLEDLIARKLAEAGVVGPSDLPAKIVEHILSGNNENFVWDDGQPTKEFTLSISKDDIDEIADAHGRFLKQELPNVIRKVAKKIAVQLGKTLIAAWPEEHVLLRAENEGFAYLLEERWGHPLDLLRIILTISREQCDGFLRRYQRSKARRNRHLREVLVRLHARACQVTAEIITLMENGYADGAIARWRTLHEICVVATVISDFGDEAAERYLMHEAVDEKRAMDEHSRCCALFGWKPPSKRNLRAVQKAYDVVKEKYGKEFVSPYGWAAEYVNKSKPSFADLEAAAGRSAMRSEYKIASHNVHAGSMGVAFKLGLLDQSSDLLTGGSNVGLACPGQNTAYSLVSITVLLFGPSFKMHDIVVLNLLNNLLDETMLEFRRVERALHRDHAKQLKALKA